MAILAEQYPMYQPAMRVVIAVTNGFPALVTTSFAHQYIDGLIARLVIPEGFGMVLAPRQALGEVTVVNDTQFLLSINTLHVEPFVIPPPFPGAFTTPAQIVPVGEINSSLRSATQNVLPYP
jgi:hypothetical protein